MAKFAGLDNLSGKPVIDTTNPIADDPPQEAWQHLNGSAVGGNREPLSGMMPGVLAEAPRRSQVASPIRGNELWPIFWNGLELPWLTGMPSTAHWVRVEWRRCSWQRTCRKVAGG